MKLFYLFIDRYFIYFYDDVFLLKQNALKGDLMRFETKKVKTKTILSFVAIGILVLFGNTQSSANCIWEPADLFTDAVDTAVEGKMELGHIPSCAFSVINGSEVFYSKSYGEQLGTDRVYLLNSISKTVAATAALALQEQGLININDDINDYLPFEIKHPLYPNTTITIKHLLAHQSGIKGSNIYWDVLLNNSYSWPGIIYESFNVNGSLYSTENFSTWEPGTSTGYSDPATDIGVFIYELAANKSYHQIVTETILTPLGMLDTEMDINEYPPEKLTTPYEWDNVQGENVQLEYTNTSFNPGGGGYWSTVDDMSKFMIAHMNQGNYAGNSILNETSIELMHTPLIGRYALGWFVEADGRQGHYGGPWYGYFGSVQLKGTIGVIFFCNQGRSNPESVAIIELIWTKALKLLNEKTCTTTKTSLYLLPIISTISAIVFIQKYRKRKD